MPRASRRFLFLALAAVVVGLAIGVWLLWPPERSSEINPENAVRIQPGMTRAEVEALLGGPPRREGDGSIEPDYEAFATEGELEQHIKASVRLTGRGAKLWRSNRAMVWVVFDEHGRVSDMTSCPARFRNVSPLDVLRDWLGL